MTTGEGPAITQAARAMRRHRLRIRTVAVSFAAAVRSAHRDLAAGPAERDALIETWRAWSLRQIDEYERDAVDLLSRAADEDAGERDALVAELRRGRRTIRDA